MEFPVFLDDRPSVENKAIFSQEGDISHLTD